MPTEPFKTRLRRLRRERDFKRSRLAEESGVSYDTIARLEQGRTPGPTDSTIEKLARALGVTPEELVGPPEDEAPSPPSRIREERYSADWDELVQQAAALTPEHEERILRLAREMAAVYREAEELVRRN